MTWPHLRHNPGVTVLTPRPRCTEVARELLEPLYGTAPVARTWILLEKPGSWGPDALSASDLDEGFVTEMDRRAQEHGFKVLLIRRSAGRAAAGTRAAHLVRSVPGQTWIRRIDLSRTEDLLEVDPALLSSPRPPDEGEAVDHLWLVCTHGRRDPCCAEYGRRLIRSCSALDGGRLQEGLWESSHLGGHRFAANLALFPHALFYGAVEPDEAPGIIDAYRTGRVVLNRYRGRSTFDRVTQAADFLVREHTGLEGVEDLLPTSIRQVSATLHEVRFDAPERSYRALLETGEGPLRRESCNKPKLTPVRTYRMVEFG